jgi:hypothetical protein
VSAKAIFAMLFVTAAERSDTHTGEYFGAMGIVSWGHGKL